MDSRLPYERKSPYVDFIGFAPDVDPTLPGVCTQMDGAIPTERGFRAMPKLDRTDRYNEFTAGYSTVPTQVYFAGGFRYVHVDTNLYVHSASTIPQDVRPYTLVAGSPISFTQLGSAVIMTNGYNTIAAAASAGGTFSAITGGPTTQKLLATASRFVLAFDGIDIWRCSARDNHLSWTANPATLAAFGQIPETYDDLIRAATTMGDDVIVLKEMTAFRGRFEKGNSEVWDWRKIALNVGAHHNNGAVPYKQGILILSDEGLFFWDGSNLTNLMDERLAGWYRKRVVQTELRNRIVVDELRDLIWVRVTLYDSDELTTYAIKVLVVDPKTRRWGVWSGTEGVSSISQGPTFYPGNYTGSAILSRSTVQNVWLIPGVAPYTPREVAGPATAAAVATISTGDFGHPFRDVELTRVSPKFLMAPTGTLPLVTGLYRNNLDESLSTTAPIARATDGHFDVHQNARWHRLKFTLYGDWEMTGYAPEMTQAGMR